MSTSTEHAIQNTDASEHAEQLNQDAPDEGSENSNYVSPRMAAMEAIAAQRREALADDGVDVSQMTADSVADTGEGSKSAQENSAAPAAHPESKDDQLAAQFAQDDRPAPETRVKVKVDGQEIELPLSEVVRSYQKDAAATKRLQEATRLLAIAGQQANKVAQIPQSENNQDVPGDDAAAKQARRSQIKGALAKLYEGDEEGAADELDQLFEQGATQQRATQASIDPAQIVTQVRQQLAVESAYSEVRSDYPELFHDTERGIVLGKETHARMVAKVAEGLPYDQALQESAEEVAALFGIAKAGRQQAQPQRTARDTKLGRKAALDTPEAANVVAGKPNSPAEAPNVSSVIAEMARNRLGQSLAPR